MTTPENGSQSADALTPVDERVQCAAASVGAEALSDTDEMAIQAFIQTLARIAHSVAARKASKQEMEPEK